MKHHLKSIPPVYIALAVIAAISFIFGLVVFALSFTFMNSELADAVATWESKNSSEQDQDAVKALMAMLRNCGVAGGISAILVSGLGIAGALMKNRAMLIVYTVFAVLLLLTNIGAASIPLFFDAVLSTACVAVQSCYSCPDGTDPNICSNLALAANKNCYYYPNDLHGLCSTFLGRLHSVVALMFIIAVLGFVNSILGCVGTCAKREEHHHYTTVVTSGADEGLLTPPPYK
eukprot:TRINITY_DN1438_c0_g1_i1.p1 TRINITY_DN1438_c0_g1~~TRINITY_DN1438_c0_g1_i1.p1  ORF type:complete len:232 (+),score=63.96 TRINITY_DN1438_c0_g1_i1:35-730(+)